jgi:hypothetical protein
VSRPLYPASRHDRPHARLYDHDLTHPAWRELSGKAFQLICTLLAAYRPNNPNSFPAGGATVAKFVNVSEKTAIKLVDELIVKGHLREERRGRNYGMAKTRERVVSLTRYDTEISCGEPERPILVWEKLHNRENLPKAPGKKSGFKKSKMAG